MASKLTITGVVGPAVSWSAKVFSKVTEIHLDTENEVLTFRDDGKLYEVSVGATTTLTFTVSGNAYSLTMA